MSFVISQKVVNKIVTKYTILLKTFIPATSTIFSIGADCTAGISDKCG
jgi:hypothetical protein